MAEKKNDEQVQAPALAVEEPRKLDETIPGGKYIRFGQLVNAHGEPIDENGKVLKKD